MRNPSLLRVVVACAAIGVVVPAASGDMVIGPGFDLLITPEFTFNGLGPAVQMVGNPIPEFGGADTAVERTSGLPGSNDTGTIDIELVALSLRSVAPVDFGGGNSYDVFIDLDPGIPSLGEIDITSHGSDGGLFDSVFTLGVFTIITFEVVSGDPAPPPIFSQDPLSSTNQAWSHTPAPGYPDLEDFPSGNFYITAAGIEHDGPHPEVVPLPAPGAVLLAMMGLPMVGWAKRRFR